MWRLNLQSDRAAVRTLPVEMCERDPAVESLLLQSVRLPHCGAVLLGGRLKKRTSLPHIYTHRHIWVFVVLKMPTSSSRPFPRPTPRTRLPSPTPPSASHPLPSHFPPLPTPLSISSRSSSSFLHLLIHLCIFLPFLLPLSLPHRTPPPPFFSQCPFYFFSSSASSPLFASTLSTVEPTWPQLVNPCYSGSHDCDTTAQCVPLEGQTFRCQCATGYRGDGRNCYGAHTCTHTHTRALCCFPM